jgi:hypothetical protein
MHSLSFVIAAIALLVAGAIAFGRGGAMSPATRIVLVVTGLAIAALTAWLSVRPGP